MYYTVIKHSLFSNVRHVLSQCNTRLRLLYLLNNLEPSYMSGSHWVATYVKYKVINYSDSLGMPPFQEMVNHAKKTNTTLLHQNNQIQNMLSATCGYF